VHLIDDLRRRLYRGRRAGTVARFVKGVQTQRLTTPVVARREPRLNGVCRCRRAMERGSGRVRTVLRARDHRRWEPTRGLRVRRRVRGARYRRAGTKVTYASAATTASRRSTSMVADSSSTSRTRPASLSCGSMPATHCSTSGPVSVVRAPRPICGSSAPTVRPAGGESQTTFANFERAWRPDRARRERRRRSEVGRGRPFGDGRTRLLALQVAAI
jgi:hypothetical protein